MKKNLSIVWGGPWPPVAPPGSATDRLEVGRFKFANRVCDEWNRLDGDIVAVKSVNAFKRKLDHHLRNVRGYF